MCQGGWSFEECTPGGDGVRKKLFNFEAETVATTTDETQWSSSEYFSQSGNGLSCVSGESPTDLFDGGTPQRQQEVA